MAHRKRCRRLRRPEELSQSRFAPGIAWTRTLIRFGVSLCKFNVFNRGKNSSAERGLISRGIGRLSLLPDRPVSLSLVGLGIVGIGDRSNMGQTSGRNRKRKALINERGSDEEIALILEKFLSSDCGPLQLARKPIIFSGNSASPLRGSRNRPYRTNTDYDFLCCPKIAIRKSRWRNT
jgi:hypothetical protein